jgi:hypothetical protein
MEKRRRKSEIIPAANCKISLFDTDTFLYSDDVLQYRYTTKDPLECVVSGIVLATLKMAFS